MGFGKEMSVGEILSWLLTFMWGRVTYVLNARGPLCVSVDTLEPWLV